MTGKTIAAVAAITLLCAGLTSQPAAAQTEASYASLGRWRVTTISNQNGFVACAADVDNGRVQLRVRFDGRGVLVGVPYYGNRNKVQGYYGFGDAAEVADFTKIDQGWAMIGFNRDQLQALRSNPIFAVNLDRGLQNFQLNGAGPALDKAQECVRNRGQAGVAGVPQTPNIAQGPAGVQPGMGRNCPAPGSLRSQNSSRKVKVTFFNGLNEPLDIYWIDYQGGLKKYHTLRGNSHVVQDTFGTHPWIAVDRRGNCRGPVFMPKPGMGDEENNFQIF